MSIANPFLQQDHHQAADNHLRRLATYASVSVATILIISKAAAYMMTDSMTVLSSLMDSVMDVLASLITLVSVRHALVPADSGHRFGHGKLESLAALGQAVFIAGSSVFLVVESIHRLISPAPTTQTLLGVGVMGLSIALTLLLVLFQRFVVRKTGSVAITADSLHYKGDLFMNLGVIAALLLNQFTGIYYFDPVFAMIIAAFMLRGAYAIGKSSFDVLLDAELPLDDREKIYNIVLGHKDAVAIHDLRTRSTGLKILIEFHLELDGHLTLNAAHDVTEDIELLLYKAFPTAEVLIHQEPAGIDDHRLDKNIG